MSISMSAQNLTYLFYFPCFKICIIFKLILVQVETRIGSSFSPLVFHTFGLVFYSFNGTNERHGYLVGVLASLYFLSSYFSFCCLILFQRLVLYPLQSQMVCFSLELLPYISSSYRFNYCLIYFEFKTVILFTFTVMQFNIWLAFCCTLNVFCECHLIIKIFH